MKNKIVKYLESSNFKWLYAKVIKTSNPFSLQELINETIFLKPLDENLYTNHKRLKFLDFQRRCYYIVHNIKNIQLCSVCNVNEKMFMSYATGFYESCNDKVCRKICKKVYIRKKNIKQKTKFTIRDITSNMSFIEKINHYVNSNAIVTLEKDILSNKNGLSYELLKEYTPFMESVDWEYLKSFSTCPRPVFYELSYRIWHLYKKIYEIPKCPICGKNMRFRNFTHGYTQTCGRDYCVKEHQKIQRVKTSQEKFGTDYPWQTQEIKDKVRKIFEEKYEGHPLRIKKYLDKQKQTNLDRTGYTSNLSNPKLKKDSMMKKYGVEHPMFLQSTKDKIENTCMIKYGVKSPMQDSVVFNKVIKSAFKWKLYTFPSGKTAKMQGYEPAALDILLERGYTEEDIVTENYEIEKFIGKIEYDNPSGKTSRYYPDIYIKSENRVIEVKSEYTYRKNKEINELKKTATEKKGIKFDFWIL